VSEAPRISIANMDVGSIWIREGELGLTADEAREFHAGKLSLERTSEIRKIVDGAVKALGNANAAGVEFWMPPHRAMA